MTGRHDSYTAKQAADFLRSLDDRPDLGGNSLAVAFGGGHGAKRAKAALAAVRLLVRSQLGEPEQRNLFGDSAA